MLAPFTIKAKVLLQQTWILGLDWDQELPPDLVCTAKAWFAELQDISTISVPRWYFSGAVEEFSVHTFSDASMTAYAAVVYIRSVNSDGVVIRKIAAKARVAPLKAVSIPRLELMGAVLGYRLTRKICTLLYLAMTKVTFWTDSLDIIHWVRSQSRGYKAFVANRISKLQEESLPKQWRHVPGVENPADDATRGLPLNQLTENHRWFAGPEFLYQDEDAWPVTKIVETSEVASGEMSKSSLTFGTITAKKESVLDLLQVARFSSLTHLKRVLCRVLRFVQLLLSRIKVESVLHTVNVKNCGISCEEMNRAEKALVLAVQQENFPDVIHSLRSGESCKKGPLRNLCPFLDSDGLMRVGGRLQNSRLPYDVQHPLILPSKTHIATLIIRRAHDVIGHGRGVNEVWAEVKQKYWIIKGREAVKRIKYECYRCRRRHEETMSQVMAPLPVSRCIPLKAFVNVGVDYAGPFTVKITRRVSAKRYLCLFTCFLSRAVHLEMAYSLDTPGFLLAFSRMVARRGKPTKVTSDNGSNFIGGESELRALVEELDDVAITNEMSNQGIEWDFNPPEGSHHGGVFESLIKSSKRCMYAILGHRSLADEELHTAIVETEGILNSRPLQYVSCDPDEEPVLTPNHFLIGQMGSQLAPVGTESLAYNPRHRWRYIQDLMGQFWRRWTKEYLTSLQPRGKWLQERESIKVGDVVLMSNQQAPRGIWPLARVVEVFPGSDSHIRTVRVLARGKEYVRPITKLVPLVSVEQQA